MDPNRKLPTDDEVRESLRRGRPNRLGEILGCGIVLVAALIGAVAGLMIFDAVVTHGEQAEKPIPFYFYLIIPGGAIVGLGASVVLLWLIKLAVGRR